MELADPTDPEIMYLDADGSVPVARPIMTGDIFTDVPCSRGGEPQTVMVVTHPCSMRTRNALLRPIVTVATIVDSPQPTFSARRWQAGQFDYMPVDNVPAQGRKSAIHLTDLHSARSDDLDLDRRIMGLSDHGVVVLLQRWIYQMSRDPVPLEELYELVAPVLAEAEIHEQWVEAAITASGATTPVPEILLQAGARVQDVLGVPGSDSLRERLKDPSSRTTVRRAVADLRRKELGC